MQNRHFSIADDMGKKKKFQGHSQIPHAAGPLDHPHAGIFLDRELSQLAFNWRILGQAQDAALPLLERLRYLCIVSSNLDEFFEVRVASLIAKGRIEGEPCLNPQIGARLDRIAEECRLLVRQQYAVLNEDILPQLSGAGVRLLSHRHRSDAQRAWVREYFDKQVRPLLTPIVLDPAHPFPRVVNKSLNFIVQLSGTDAFGRGNAIAILKAPRVLPRIIRLPQELAPDGQAFCTLSSIIRAHIADLFAGREVIAHSQFRVTRNSDLTMAEEDVKDLRLALQSELLSRPFGFAVRLEVSHHCPPHLAAFLLEHFSIDKRSLYPVEGPVNLVRLQELIDHVKTPDLHFPPFAPALPAVLAEDDMFAVLRRQDVLLHHPFQSFQLIIDFIRKAALDPDVIGIKQTIYRTGMNSELMEALVTAARRGKEVTVVVELLARFDEEANMNWAERLQEVGAQVVYGVVGLKTHAKIALVLRRDGKDGRTLRHYAHLGTGNYHPTTTKLYTDFGLLTANPALTAEVSEVFNHLTSLTKPLRLQHLWLAPTTLHANVIAAIAQEASLARKGRPARIVAKMNALVDEEVILALYDASSAGVKIDLIVRGACALRPGVAGLSENIRVRSVVGRFLEHTRIYYFHDDGRRMVYLSSADWMRRNLQRRVEVAFPVLDEALKRRVVEEGLDPYLRENDNAWELDSDGRYRRVKPGRKDSLFSAQQFLSESLRPTALQSG
jgi:polyphosphate kinase